MAAVLRRAVAQRCTSLSPAYGLRRFMQEQPAFRPAVPPDRFMPLADRIRDLGFGFPRINLDGLVPPAAPPATAAAPTPSLTVEEARKVLRATQMEVARARLRESGAGAVSHAEYLRLCCDAVGADAGPSVARALDESGSVIVLGKTVFLRPDMVVKAIEKAIPVRQALPPVDESHPAREELKAMEAEKADIDLAAASRVRRELWCGLAYLVVQTAGFMRLTFWELSWDVMEPICFYVTSMYFMAGYAFFLRTKKEPSFEGFFESRFAAKQRRLMRGPGVRPPPVRGAPASLRPRAAAAAGPEPQAGERPLPLLLPLPLILSLCCVHWFVFVVPISWGRFMCTRSEARIG